MQHFPILKEITQEVTECIMGTSTVAIKVPPHPHISHRCNRAQKEKGDSKVRT